MITFFYAWMLAESWDGEDILAVALIELLVEVALARFVFVFLFDFVRG